MIEHRGVIQAPTTNFRWLAEAPDAPPRLQQFFSMGAVEGIWQDVQLVVIGKTYPGGPPEEPTQGRFWDHGTSFVDKDGNPVPNVHNGLVTVGGPATGRLDEALRQVAELKIELRTYKDAVRLERELAAPRPQLAPEAHLGIPALITVDEMLRKENHTLAERCERAELKAKNVDEDRAHLRELIKAKESELQEALTDRASFREGASAAMQRGALLRRLLNNAVVMLAQAQTMQWGAGETAEAEFLFKQQHAEWLESVKELVES